MAGPNVQISVASLPVFDKDGYIRQEWQSVFQAMQQIAFNVSRSGTTAERPTDKTPNRFIGMPYLDTTIGKPVWLYSVNPVDVWIDATGAPA